ncbi:hypothetical protein Ga0100231_005005 [Opitutaceae bacterium TAV4]|nr:hypothetical protein Ga0100231_005005 [Opitutaceae bacterium TAV4]RRK02354.1 hypothetical protein Ga0100230_004150 [Opitutaceae bacterium TAV3]
MNYKILTPLITFLALILLASAHLAIGASSSPLDANTQNASARPVKFRPGFAEYSVTFPSPPKKSEQAVETEEGEQIKSVVAELETKTTYLKAEFAQISPVAITLMTEDEMRQRAFAYARHNGLTAPQVRIERTALGRKVSIRGTKILSGIAITYEMITYYGKSTMTSVYVGVPSSDYPTRDSHAFLQSVTER